MFNHDHNIVLGRSSVGTLRLVEDAKGLRYELDINAEDPLAMSVLAKVKRGDIYRLSFAFTVHHEDETWMFDPKHVEPLRTVYRVASIDVSPVTWPAYSQTSGARAV